MLDIEGVAEKKTVRKRTASVKMELPHNMYYRLLLRYHRHSIHQVHAVPHGEVCAAKLDKNHIL